MKNSLKNRYLTWNPQPAEDNVPYVCLKKCGHVPSDTGMQMILKSMAKFADEVEKHNG